MPNASASSRVPGPTPCRQKKRQPFNAFPYAPAPNRFGTPVTIVATATASTTAAPTNTPAAPFASNTTPPAAAPVAIAS